MDWGIYGKNIEVLDEMGLDRREATWVHGKERDAHCDTNIIK